MSSSPFTPLRITAPMQVQEESPELAQTTGARRASWVPGAGISSGETSPGATSTSAAARRRRRLRSRHSMTLMGPIPPPSPTSSSMSPQPSAGLSPPSGSGGGDGRMEAKLAMSLAADDSPTLPLLSPVVAQHQATSAACYGPGGSKSLSGIALRAFLLGGALAVSAVACVASLAVSSTPLWRLPFFGGCLAAFHFLEFWTTARYNHAAASVDSFLLTANWPAYAVAHASAALECLVVGALFPSRSWAPLHTGPLLLLAGLALVVVGQTVRSAAMAQAGPSFNHIVQQARAPQHQLVTTGIYATLRHPSYFGFFYWALGTQLVLGNIVCFAAYAVVLWKFFSSRIRREEAALVRMFGDEYVAFRKAVGTKIPFIP